MSFFSTSNILVHIPLWRGRLRSVVDRSHRHAVRVAVHLVRQQGKNHQLPVRPDQRHAVRGDFLPDPAVRQPAAAAVLFGANIYGWYAWSRQTQDNQAELQIRWLPLPKALAWAAVCVIGIGLMTFNIDRVFAWLTQIAVAVMQGWG